MVEFRVELRMDLKICERCGALWLRVIGAEARHCGRCLGQLGELPVRRGCGREDRGIHRYGGPGGRGGGRAGGEVRRLQRRGRRFPANGAGWLRTDGNKKD